MYILLYVFNYTHPPTPQFTNRHLTLFKTHPSPSYTIVIYHIYALSILPDFHKSVRKLVLMRVRYVTHPPNPQAIVSPSFNIFTNLTHPFPICISTFPAIFYTILQ